MSAPLKTPHETLLEHVRAMQAIEAHCAERLAAIGTGNGTNERDARRAACRVIASIETARSALSTLETLSGVTPR